MPEATRQPLRAGLCSVTLRELDIDQVVAAATAADLAGIEWGADVHVPPNDGPAIAQARRATESAGLVCASYGSYLNPASTDDEIEAALATAQALGAPNVRIWAGGKEPALEGGRWHHEDWGVAVDRLRAIAAAASKRSLTVGLEFHGWTLTHWAGAAQQLVVDVGADNLYTYFQPNYWHEATVNDADAQVAELTTVLGHLSHLHLYWWPALGERSPLADGEAVLQPILNAATDSAGQWRDDRWVFLEFVKDDDPEQLVADGATLLRLLSSTQHS